MLSISKALEDRKSTKQKETFFREKNKKEVYQNRARPITIYYLAVYKKSFFSLNDEKKQRKIIFQFLFQLANGYHDLILDRIGRDAQLLSYLFIL